MEFIIKVFLKECKLEKIRTRTHITNFLKEICFMKLVCFTLSFFTHLPLLPPLFTRRVAKYGELGSVYKMPTVLDNFYFHKKLEQSLPALRHVS